MTKEAKAKAQQLLKNWNVIGTFKDNKFFFSGLDMGICSPTAEKEYYLTQINETTIGSFVGQELRNEFTI